MKVVRPVIASNRVPYLQIMSRGSHSSSGSEKIKLHGIVRAIIYYCFKKNEVMNAPKM